MKNKRIQIIWRYGLVSAVITILAFLIVWCAVKTTIVDADKWNAKADSLLTRVFMVQPVRGEIMADDGSMLATNLTAYTICVDYKSNAKKEKLFIESLDSLCDSLAVYYPVRDKKEWRLYLARPLAEAPENRKTAHVLIKDGTYTDYKTILNFPFFKRFKNKYSHGLYYTTKDVRVMPYGSMARRSIGRCNYRTVPRYQDTTISKATVDILHGYSGIEASLDSLLYGKAGTAKFEQLTHGIRTWVHEPAINGFSVRTTIDINMQDIVETELQEMLKKTSAEWGTCLLMEVATGDIKAISNLDRDKDGNYIEAMNYALQGYEPGSVMKPISMIVALEDGYAFPLDKTMPIGHAYAYAGGSPIHDTHSPAELPVSRFIEYSSNIGMTKLIAPQYEDDLNGFRERLKKIGLFDTIGTEMMGERPPYFPTLDPKAGGKVSLSRMAYGYSTQIPPLYTCAIYNAIANDGKFVRPRIVKELINDQGQRQQRPVTYVREHMCSPENAKILRKMIHDVVYGEGGTAKSLRSDIVKVVGKTGTCRIANEVKKDSTKTNVNVIKGYKEGQYRLAFCGFFPYETPQYTCMVLISNPSPEYKGAATTSGTVVKNVALKMHARGMLNNHSDFLVEENAKKHPTLYASAGDIRSTAKRTLGVSNPGKIKNPSTQRDGTTPDVRGLSVREAIGILEDAGYNVDIHGTGYAHTQAPAPGTTIRQGATVTVRFSPN